MDPKFACFGGYLKWGIDSSTVEAVFYYGTFLIPPKRFRFGRPHLLPQAKYYVLEQNNYNFLFSPAGKKPKPVCMGLPGGISKFCGRVYGISKEKDQFKACLGLELRALDDVEAALRVSCFKFGPQGLNLEPGQPVPASSEDKDDEDDDDDDDDDDLLGGEWDTLYWGFIVIW
jgi:hypothetical protein